MERSVIQDIWSGMNEETFDKTTYSIIIKL
jgi:hypothetical protein